MGLQALIDYAWLDLVRIGDGIERDEPALEHHELGLSYDRTLKKV